MDVDMICGRSVGAEGNPMSLAVRPRTAARTEGSVWTAWDFGLAWRMAMVN